jgi:hypothetical protein
VKRSVFIFLSAVLLSLLAVPLFNILAAPSRDAIKWKEKSFLYNVDFASRWVALFLYPLGISTDPKQVIIGRDGWLYLGDLHQQTLTVDRRPPSKADFVLGQEIGRAAEAWDAYLSSKGVKLFRVMIAPNKSTIYPEFLPLWAKQSAPNATDALLAGTGTAHYVDLRGPLLAAKENQPEALYYKTDSHWNSLGAGVAFRAFAQQVGPAAPEIQWPSQKVYELNRVDPRGGADLAGFLRLTADLSDYEPMIHASSLSIETRQSDFDTKQVLHQGGNPRVGVPKSPRLVQSVGALNNKKVLWLRDSYGIALSPLMAATFSEVLQLDWGEAIKPGGRLLQLVEEWNPDYVFVSVVERLSTTPLFAAYPPPAIVPKREGFKPIRATSVVGLNHLLKGTTDSDFQITGIDPFVEFAMSNAANPSEVRYLNIDLTCADSSPSVPLQLFWLEAGRPHFDEEHSARFSIRTGDNLIDLRTIQKLSSASAISRIRVDIDAPSSCAHFKLKNPVLGLNDAKH